MSQNQRQQEMFSNRDGFNLLMLLAGAFATTVTVFIRRDFGTNALGRRGYAALLLLLATIGFGAPRTRAIMQPYLVTWLIALVLQRLRTARFRASGHSQYDGWPWLAMLIPGVKSEKTAKMSVEPLLCFVAGIALGICGEAYHAPELRTLGGWFLISGLALAFDYGVYEAVQIRRTQAIRDAYIEEEQLRQRLRDEGWRR